MVASTSWYLSPGSLTPVEMSECENTDTMRPGFTSLAGEGKLAVADGGDGRAVAMQETGAAMACKQRHKLDVRDCVVDPSAERTIDMECSGPVKPPDFQCGRAYRVVLLGRQRDGMVV